jgi:hypothetical protein
MALHALPDDLPFEDVEGRKHANKVVVPLRMYSCVMVPVRPSFTSKPGWGPVGGLDPRFLVDREHSAVRHRVDIKADDVVQLWRRQTAGRN